MTLISGDFQKTCLGVSKLELPLDIPYKYISRLECSMSIIQTQKRTNRHFKTSNTNLLHKICQSAEYLGLPFHSTHIIALRFLDLLLFLSTFPSPFSSFLLPTLVVPSFSPPPPYTQPQTTNVYPLTDHPICPIIHSLFCFLWTHLL